MRSPNLEPVTAKLGASTRSIVAVFGLLLAFSALAATDAGQTFTLYRNSVLNPKMRIHVATFDADDGAAYNSGNCNQAQSLFEAQDGVKTKFWCEKGRFKK